MTFNEIVVLHDRARRAKGSLQRATKRREVFKEEPLEKSMSSDAISSTDTKVSLHSALINLKIFTHTISTQKFALES